MRGVVTRRAEAVAAERRLGERGIRVILFLFAQVAVASCGFGDPPPPFEDTPAPFLPFEPSDPVGPGIWMGEVWPVGDPSSGSGTYTSYGPRIREKNWHFHHGIDIPAPMGAAIRAVSGGMVYRAGPRNSSHSSRHIVIQVSAHLRHYYLHLSAPPISAPFSEAREGDIVTRGQPIGFVGSDGATHPHLHFEARRAPFDQEDSFHPLSSLPYDDTPNFHFLDAGLVRYNQVDDRMAVRVLFGAASRNEGDLAAVEATFWTSDLTTLAHPPDRLLELGRDTPDEDHSHGDDHTYRRVGGRRHVGLEGYQRSNMGPTGDNRTDLEYGLIIGAVPPLIDRVAVVLKDLGGNTVGASFSIPLLSEYSAVDESLAFDESSALPPGWETRATSVSGSLVTMVERDRLALLPAVSGAYALSCVDASGAEEIQRACIEYELPSGRFEWIAEGWFNPVSLQLDRGDSVHLLYFLTESLNLSVAARIRNVDGVMQAGITYKTIPDDDYPDGVRAINVGDEAFVDREGGDVAPADLPPGIGIVVPGRWVRWRLHLLRVGTRESTAVLYIGGTEVYRVRWDTRVAEREPRFFRCGIGRSSAGAKVSLLVDNVLLSEKIDVH